MSRPFANALIILLLLVLPTSCWFDDDEPDRIPVIQNQRSTLLVFAAASLTDLFQAVEKAFEQKHPGVDVLLNIAGSQQLSSQIQLDAPADIFASADTVNMQQLVANGTIDKDAVRIFARNQLVLITPPDNPAGLTTFSALSQKDLKLVLAAREVPAGRYTHLLLDNTVHDPAFKPDFEHTVLNQVVSFEQNVRAVRTKVILGEADAGVVYKSDITHARDQLISLPIPESISPEVLYPIAPLHSSPNYELACTFVEFVLSEEGQQLLARHGFVTP